MPPTCPRKPFVFPGREGPRGRNGKGEGGWRSDEKDKERIPGTRSSSFFVLDIPYYCYTPFSEKRTMTFVPTWPSPAFFPPGMTIVPHLYRGPQSAPGKQRGDDRGKGEGTPPQKGRGQGEQWRSFCRQNSPLQ